MNTKSKQKRAATAVEIGRETRLELYRQQLELRYCEKRAYDLFLQNLVKGTSHLSLGQEAIAAGFGVAMRPDDWTFCTYRGHAHTLARGVSMTSVLPQTAPPEYLYGPLRQLASVTGETAYLAAWRDRDIRILASILVDCRSLPVVDMHLHPGDYATMVETFLLPLGPRLVQAAGITAGTLALRNSEASAQPAAPRSGITLDEPAK